MADTVTLANNVPPSDTFTTDVLAGGVVKVNTIWLSTVAVPKLASTPAPWASKVTLRSSTEAPVINKRVSVPTRVEYRLPLTTTE